MFGTFMSTLDSSIVNIALPTIRRELGAGDSVEWIVLCYLLTTTSTLLIMGKLSDWVGRRQLYITGFCVFVLGSLLCGLAWNLWSLVGFRVLQGIGASMIYAVGPAIISDTFAPQERGQALGIMGSIVAAGSSAGPVIGGFLLGKFGWSSIFFVNVPIGLLAIWRAWTILPASPKVTGQRFDLVGAGLFLVGVTTLLTGLDFGPEPRYGWNDPLVVGLLSVGGILLVLFLIWEMRVKEPMLRLNLFRIRPFTAAILAAFCGFIASGSNLFVIPFFLQQILAFNPERAGLVLLAGPLTLSVIAPLGGYLSSRVSTRWLSSFGLLITAGGYFAFSFLDASWDWKDVIWRSALVSLGFGLFQSPNSSSALNAAPLEQRGIASSMIAFMRNLGFVVGIALAAAVWYSTRNRYALAHEVTPEATTAQLLGMHYAYLTMASLVLTGALISLTRGKSTQPVAVAPTDGQTVGMAT
ncbi:EmrB/QacA subfamily drug resistance transporter [Spirosoma radiotolerans]|uniref:EmrB/QacA subfamily drug resistance transporter n=2 Tax=Spirosoma radiotolerans TaxID=1379870 RepID=A0A0E3V6G3_9BACT|nr:EmrB/QacA subfamily drug resistance transporter [Spirosoma radiotolerans]